MKEKIMVAFINRSKNKVIIITDKKRTTKLSYVVELIGYNSDYVAVVQSPSVDKIKIYDAGGCQIDIIDRNSSLYL